MKIERLIVGPLQANCYIVWDDKTLETIIIDPGDEPDRIIEVITEKKLRVKYLLCTHGHFDHVGALPELKRHTKAPVTIHEDEKEIYEAATDMAIFFGYDIERLPPVDIFLKNGEKITAGDMEFTVINTPGHSPGSISLYGNGVIFTGDTVFQGSVGRTDFYGGNMELLKESFKKIMSLEPSTKILSGHGPETTVERERIENFFINEIK